MGVAESKSEDFVPLSDLEKEDLLGHGAMCQVFKARWTSKNLPVALKQMMVPDVVPEDLADFRRELLLTRTMKHPNLVYLYGGSAEPPNLYLVMELVEHGAASELLRSKKGKDGLPWALRYRMAIDTALAMRFLHSKKVMHRDLKTENLLVNSLQPDAETVIKITDLGISRLSEGNADAVMTVGRGTTKWMAPEILEGSTSYSFPVDVYSFGIILWEFFSQEIPYTEVRSALRLPEMIVTGYRPQIPRNCPPAYLQLMQDCWHGDPAKRPTFDEVTKRLFEMKDEVCPGLTLPPSVMSLYENFEAKAPTKSAKLKSASITKDGAASQAAKEKKEKRKTKMKKDKKKKGSGKSSITNNEKANKEESSTQQAPPAKEPVPSPSSSTGPVRKDTRAEPNSSDGGSDRTASVGSMVRRFETSTEQPKPSVRSSMSPRPSAAASLIASAQVQAQPNRPPVKARAATIANIQRPVPAGPPRSSAASSVDELNRNKSGGRLAALAAKFEG